MRVIEIPTCDTIEHAALDAVREARCSDARVGFRFNEILVTVSPTTVPAKAVERYFRKLSKRSEASERRAAFVKWGAELVNKLREWGGSEDRPVGEFLKWVRDELQGEKVGDK